MSLHDFLDEVDSRLRDDVEKKKKNYEASLTLFFEHAQRLIDTRVDYNNIYFI